jgi:alpha-mannosidase
VDVRTEVVWNEDDRQLSVEFEPAIAPTSATWEIPYGTMSRAIRPETEAVRSEAVFPGQRWADVSADGYGFSVLTDAGREWEVRGGTMELRLARASTPADQLNNPLTIRFAIYPHAGDWIEAGTHRLAADYEVPLVAGIELSHKGRLGKSFSFLSTNHASVGLEWIKRAEDGDAFVVRLVEWAGEETEVEVLSACPEIFAQRANLLEDPGDHLPSSRGRFRIRLRPHEIATVLMQCRV